MSSDDWFRRTTWTDDHRTDFSARLKRARESNRPQYLRIQAVHLAGAGNHVAALDLLERLLNIDDGGIDLAQAQLQRAESFLATGNERDAIDAFLACLDAERKRPNVQTEAWLLFPWFIVETQNVALYAEARDILSEFAKLRSPTFPISEYRLHCVKAILLAHDGDEPQARVHAENALAAANATHSGFRYHARLGLVRDTSSTVHECVCIIAAK
jgi:tetratricopeptide (TPR) repeat protein